MGIGRPKKYHSEEERREAARQRNWKYYNQRCSNAVMPAGFPFWLT